MSQTKSFVSSVSGVKLAPLKIAVPKVEVKVEAPPKIWRVTEPELEELVTASVPLFLERFPRLEMIRTVSYIRSALYENSARVMRTENSWYMARADRNFFEPKPIVYEIFMCSFKPSRNDIVYLANDMVDWGRKLGAVEVRIGSATEYDVGPLAKRIGATRKQITYVKTLEV